MEEFHATKLQQHTANTKRATQLGGVGRELRITQSTI